MKETFLDTADQILGFRSSRDNLVKKMVITLIPTLAAYDTQTFSEHFLHKAMAHLLTQLEKPNERSFGECFVLFYVSSTIYTHKIAFIAIGHTATAVGSDMKPFLDSIMSQVKDGLQNRWCVTLQPTVTVTLRDVNRKKNSPSEEPIFQCMGMLAQAVGPNLTKLLHDQLDLMFACSLSESLRQALVAIARHIPPLLRTIQGKPRKH
jgi:serine/threonine-protein kinase mTOR